MQEMIEVAGLEELSEPMTELEAYELTEQLRAANAQIKEQEEIRDKYLALFKERMAQAEELCESKTKASREKVARLTEMLRRYTEANTTAKVRSVQVLGALMSLRKQQPKFFYEGKEVTNKTTQLLEFVKGNAPDFLKVKVEESVDWLKFKGKLTVDGDKVFYAPTGELINGLHAQEQPDKFTVTLA